MSKWLIRKTSGSRKKYTISKDYAETRNAKKADLDNLPKQESMSNNRHSYLDTTLVKRWLYAKVGQDFDSIYAEFLTRIQPKYLDQYRDCIFWYVEKDVEFKENGEIWGTFNGNPVKLPYTQNAKFYIHPETHTLERLSKV